MKAIKPRAVDVRELRLAPDEGYILSRIDGPLSLRELSAISGLGEEQVADIVSRLVAHGVIEGPPGLLPGVVPPSAQGTRSGPESGAEPKTLPRMDAPKLPSDHPSPTAEKTLPRADAPKLPPDHPSPLDGGSISEVAPMSPRPSPPRTRVSTRVPGMPPPGARPPARPPGAPGPISTRISVVPPAPARAPTAPPSAPSVAPAAAATAAVAAAPVPAPPPAPRVSSKPPAAEKAPQLGSVEVGVWGITDVGVARKNNEDCFQLVDLTESGEVAHASSVEVGAKGIMLTVSDGMGGENAGEVASAITVASMREYVQAGLHEDPGEALAASVVHANKKVMDAATAPERAGMGAAVVSVLVRQGIAHVTEVGDCRAYLHRSGALTQLTKDQTHVQVLIDQGLMTPEAAKKSRAKSVVLQAVGKTEELSVTQRALALRDGDRLLLCSDGLTVNVTDAEIAEKLGGLLEGAVESLIALANERGGVDNVTVVIAEVTGALQPSRPEETVTETLQTIRQFEIGGGSE